MTGDRWIWYWKGLMGGYREGKDQVREQKGVRMRKERWMGGEERTIERPLFESRKNVVTERVHNCPTYQGCCVVTIAVY